MIYRTIYGTKIGETILLDENGSPVYVIKDTFYPIGLSGYWLIKSSDNQCQIIRYHDNKSYE